jgi:hypothetical protein
MRKRLVVALAAVGFAILVTSPSQARRPGYLTLSGGWAWPVEGPLEANYEPGFTMAGSIRLPIEADHMYGFEAGYSWFSFDRPEIPPGAGGGGDLGLFHLTTENDYLFGARGSSARPFVNAGMGFYSSSIDDGVAGGTGVYEGSFFGLHGGVGLLYRRDRFGLRIDATYHHLFSGGDDPGYVPVRAGLIFRPR